MWSTIYLILVILFSFFLFFPAILSFFYLLRPKKTISISYNGTFPHIACIVTIYKHVEIALPLIRSILHQKYDNIHIYAVADNSQRPPTLPRDEKLSFLFPEPPLHLKAKSIIYATERFVKKPDYIAVFDADNLVSTDFFFGLISYVQKGYSIVQGRRVAKNLDTTIARLDALGEFYKNYVDRMLPYNCGSSAVLSGSGMILKSDLYLNHLYGHSLQSVINDGRKMKQEDKILQNDLLIDDHCIAFAHDVIVYDEKITRFDQVSTQRARWLYSYFQNIPASLNFILIGVKRLSINHLIFGLTSISPPIFISISINIFLIIIGLIIQDMAYIIPIIGLLFFVNNILLSLIILKAPLKVWQSIWAIPVFVFGQILGLFKMINPTKYFNPSDHGTITDIEDFHNDK